MTMRRFFTTLILIAALCCSTNAWAASDWYVHDFACDNCHKQGADFTALASNVCLGCHAESALIGDGLAHLKAPVGTPIKNSSKIFRPDMASDAQGSRSAQLPAIVDIAGSQSSHNWSASYANDAAGASAPSDTKFYGRQNLSGTLVTCSRCHDPHGSAVSYSFTPYGSPPITIEANPKLLKLGVGTEDTMCVECHTAWDLDTTSNPQGNAWLTHPLVEDYPSFQAANPTKYKPFVGNGEMVLGDSTSATPVANSIICSTCHGTHFSDSDALTSDTAGLAVSVGDGYMLKGNGRLTGDASGICQSCHVYQGHGAGLVGCIDCHSGHSFNSGTPNYFVLRDTVTLATYPAGAPASPGTNLDYTSATSPWKTGAGTGYCEGCHPVVSDSHNGDWSALPAPTQADCTSIGCHVHADTTSSFKGGTCNQCHGYPPVDDTRGAGTIGTTTTGYAYDPVSGFDYNTDPDKKLEVNAKHGLHAGPAAGQYKFACGECHGGYAHKSGSFQDVFLAPTSFVTASGAFVPTYAKAGDGTCAAVYCHSNGGPRGAAPTAASVPTWQNGAAVTCASCHGNNDVTMAAAGNSATHQAHLAKGYDCSLCHAGTATNATTLAAGAIQGTHVNGTADVAFDGSALTQLNAVAGSYTAVAGTCQTVYCHSNGANGAPLQTPDWDDATTGDCGSCHDVSGQFLSFAHPKHVFDTDGPQLACTTCHTNNGSGADHINQFVDKVASLQTAVCDACHGIDGTETSPDWTVAGSDDCLTCHTGLTFSTIGTQAPDKNRALSTGHNLTSGNYAVSGNGAANRTCEDCHDKNATHLTGSGNMRLQAGFDCATCHAAITTHQAKGCTACHDPHGTSNIYMVKANSADFSGVSFTAKIGANSYDEDDNGDKTGASAGVESNSDDICATCHTLAGGTPHNNSDNSSALHNQGNSCIPCHLSHTNPIVSGGAFAVGGGDSCDSCHGYPPLSGPGAGAHALHAPDSVIADAAGKVYRDATNGYADVSACVYCHTGADQYTYNFTDDQAAGGVRGNHNLGDANQKAVLNTNVNVAYNLTDFNCASACHASTLADGTWSDTALDCNACHFYATGAALTSANNTADANALTGTHGTHFDSSATIECSACHAVTADTAHITTGTGTEIQKVQGRAQALQDEAAVLSSVGTDPAGPTEPTCNNAACHDPSNTGYSATWNGPAATCDLCHSSTDPATKNHSAHLNAGVSALGKFGADITCTECHVDNGVDTKHRDGTVDVTGSKITAAYVDSASTCTNSCHQDGVNGAPATAVNWDMAAQVDCTICHTLQPATGSHAKHLTVSAGATCANCHDNTVEGTSAAVQHLDLNLDVFDTIATDLGYPADKLLAGAGATCNAASCHDDGRSVTLVTTPDWGTETACTECHSLPMATGSHGVHLTSTMPVTAIVCTACHAAGTDPAAGPNGSEPIADHRDGFINTNATLQYGIAPFTSKDKGTAFVSCAAASCHDNGLGVKTAQTWGDTTVPACNACHSTVPGTGKHAKHLDHVATAGMPAIGCGDCHTGAVAGTTIPTTGHADGAVDVANGYTTSPAAYGPGTWTGTCSTNCHTDAQSATNGGPATVRPATPAWNDAGTCGACHAAVPSSAKHTAHINTYGATCGDCHDTAGSGAAIPTANHLNNLIDVRTQLNYSQVGTPGNGWGSCNNPSGLAGACHGVADVRNWDASVTDCASCHGGSTSATTKTGEPRVAGDMMSGLPLGQHVKHLPATPAIADCNVCHSGHAMPSLDGKIQITFTGQAAGGAYDPSNTNSEWTYDQPKTNAQQECSNIYCHSNGQAADGGAGALTYTAPDWGNQVTGQCGTCHGGNGIDGDTLSVVATGSHTAHVVKSGYACDECHLGNTHVNAALEVTTGSYTSAVLGNGYGTCSTASCHDDGTGTLKAPTDTWGALVTDCTECHAGAAIATGSHTVHLSAPVSAACTDCHASGTDPASETAPSAGHRNGVIDTLASLTYGNSTKGGPVNYSSCATASCHVTNRNTTGQTPVWGGPAITNCTECHSPTPSDLDTHNAHTNASGTVYGQAITCASCHDAATDVTPGSETAPAAGHRNDFVDATAYPVKAIGDASYLSCAAASCHQNGQTLIPTYTPTSTFDDLTPANCSQCHAASPISGAHAKHIAVTNDCATCHTADAVKDTSYGVAAHGDGNVNVVVESNTFSKVYGSTPVTCLTVSCHGDGQTTAGQDSPRWDQSAGCAACHMDNEGTNFLVSGSHDEHLTSAIITGITCADCHVNADPAAGPPVPPNNHGDGTIEVTGYPANVVVSAVAGGNWTTCSAVACHENGAGVTKTTPAWGTATAACDECHGAVPNTNAHLKHFDEIDPATGLTVTCGTCHPNADSAGYENTAAHINGTINIDAAMAYTAGAEDKGGVYGSCATAACHNDGTTGSVYAPTPLWDTATPIGCTNCHATQPSSESHGKHLTAGATCGTCHLNAVQGSNGGDFHADGNIDTVVGLGYEQNHAYGAANGTCANVSCHDDGTGTPVALTPTWGPGTPACTACHEAAPTTGAHQKHLVDATNYILTPAIACDSCHIGAVEGSDAGATHRDGNVDVASEKLYGEVGFETLDVLGYPSVNPLGDGYGSCNTAYCHGDRLKNGSVSTGLNFNANPNWGDTVAVGKDCEFCHDMAPLDIGAHGTATLTTCVNCHGGLPGEDLGEVNSTGTGFTNSGATHVNGVLNGGGDNCNDCHSSIGGVGNGPIDLSAAHAAHVTTAYVGKLSTNDYGNAAKGWYKYSSNAGVYDIGCGFCHPATVAGHGNRQVSLDPALDAANIVGTVKAQNDPAAAYAGLGGSCSGVYCHSDGSNVAAGVSPNWSGGSISGNCTDCHTNTPSTGAHSVHTVGIHYTDLYDSDRLGVMQAAAATSAAHGNAATATTITCALCHSTTVTLTQNDQNDVCGSCHGSSAVLKGNLAISGNGTHINGQPDVQIDLTGFKTTAQLRDDITGVTSLNTNWTRTNGYKDIGGLSHDAAKTGASYATGSCSAIVCHNGGSASWNDPVAGDCQKCHTELPQ